MADSAQRFKINLASVDRVFGESRRRSHVSSIRNKDWHLVAMNRLNGRTLDRVLLYCEDMLKREAVCAKVPSPSMLTHSEHT